MKQYTIGVDLGGTNIAAGLVDAENKIVDLMSCKTNLPRPSQAVSYTHLMERVRRELKPCGIVFLGGSARALAQRLAAAPMPCVLATTVAPDIQAPGLSMVGVDDRAAGRLAAQYLLAQGHRQLGVIGGDNAP